MEQNIVELKTENVNEEVTVETPTAEEAKEGAEAVKAAKPEEKPINPFDPDEAARAVKHGKLKLAEPIQDGENTYDELEYDFGALKGLELARALDFGDGPKDSFRLTDVQALNYFACAAAKCQKSGGLDVIDIRERIGGMDAIKAIQLATVFFRASSRAGDKRLSKA